MNKKLTVVGGFTEKIWPSSLLFGGKMKKIQENILYLGFSYEDSVILCDYYARKQERILRMAACAYDGSFDAFPICRSKSMERLLILCSNVPQYRKQYQDMHIPDEIIKATLQEISKLAQEYRRRRGALGLSCENVIWLRHIHNGHLFQIGSLQYQLFHMVYMDEEGIGETYMQFSVEQKRKLPPGTPVVNMHIPTGADLSAESVSDSIDTARRLFQECFPEFGAQAFLCYSWMLYPPMRELLPENSRIAAFAERFQIIAQVRDPYGSDAVRRIYGKRYQKKSEYPCVTRLQKNMLGNFSKLGMACGIIENT